MTARVSFKQADLTRILRSSEKAKVPVRIEIEQDRMIVPIVDAKSADPDGNVLDEMFG